MRRSCTSRTRRECCADNFIGLPSLSSWARVGASWAGWNDRFRCSRAHRTHLEPQRCGFESRPFRSAVSCEFDVGPSGRSTHLP